MFVIGTVGYLSFVAYGYLSSEYPVRVKLENTDGRSLMVTLLARNETHIEFTRDDEKKFIYPIESLTAVSQQLVRRYSNTGINEVAPHFATLPANKDVSDLHLKGIREKVEALSEEIRLKGYELRAAESGSQRRSISRDIQALELKLRKLKLKEAEHLSRKGYEKTQ